MLGTKRINVIQKMAMNSKLLSDRHLCGYYVIETKIWNYYCCFGSLTFWTDILSTGKMNMVGKFVECTLSSPRLPIRFFEEPGPPFFAFCNIKWPIKFLSQHNLCQMTNISKCTLMASSSMKKTMLTIQPLWWKIHEEWILTVSCKKTCIVLTCSREFHHA